MRALILILTVLTVSACAPTRHVTTTWDAAVAQDLRRDSTYVSRVWTAGRRSALRVRRSTARVTGDSLFIVEASGERTDLGARDIVRVRTAIPSGASTGVLVGGLVGAATGAIVGYATGDDSCGGMLCIERKPLALFGAMILGIPAAALGGILGAAVKPGRVTVYHIGKGGAFEVGPSGASVRIGIDP